MKDLPKIFQNNANKKFNNNNSVYYSNKDIRDSNYVNNTYESKTVLQKINEIFSSPNYVYKANVEITLKDKKLIKRIIGRNKDFIITMDNTLIPVKDIIDIKSIKK